MRFKFLILMLALSFLAQPLFAQTEKLKGEDWLTITEQRKIYFSFGKIESPEYEGIVFSHAPMEYISIMDQKIAQDPKLKTEDMDEIFQKTIYESEEKSRSLLDSRTAKKS